MSDLQKILSKKINKTSIYDKLLSEQTVYSGLTIGDFLYDYLRVEPLFLKALKFSHPNNEMNNALEIGWYKYNKKKYFDSNSTNPEKSFEGHEVRDSGYYAEQFYAQSFQSQGLEVELPASTNNPGYDLIVSGQKIQAKLGNSQLIEKHFEKYPDIKVIANNEAVEEFLLKNPHMSEMVLKGGDGDLIKDTYFKNTQLSRELIEDESLFNSGLPEILSIGLIISVGKNSYSFLVKDKTFKDTIKHTAIDTSSRVASLSAGSTAGAMLFGFLAGGPYGFIAGKFIGGALGLYGGNQISKVIKHTISCQNEKQDLENKIKIYLDAVFNISKRNKEVFDKKANDLQEYSKNINDLWKMLRFKLDDEENYKSKLNEKLKMSLKDLSCLSDNYNYLSELADEALFLGNKLGVPHYIISREAEDLALASKKYNECISRIL